ncbi:MAG: T9SS type A sorting domain-containing protein, partial [Sediminibacterium sp.]|nr:T9SS type A sorting domain-containing protein [Sediminibacterium sp.]
DDDHNAGNGNSSVEMTGLFIAEKIASNGKNVTWNSFSCDALPVAVNNSSFVNRLVTEEKQNTTGEEALKVTVLPNPSTTYFTLKFESRYQAPVELRVIDSRGRLVDAKSKIASNSTIQIGHNYSSGTYFAEMIQGTRRKVVQLIKGKD